MNALGEFIKSERDRLGLSLRSFGKLCDISHTHIDSIEKGVDFRTGKTVRVTNDTLLKIANALSVEPNFLFDLSIGMANDNKEVSSSNVIRIPVLGSIAAGIPIEAITDVVDYEEIDKVMESCGEYIGLKIKGDSMAPRIQNGDVVIIKRQQSVNSGEVAAILINGDDATLKKVIKDENGIQLISYNQEIYPPKFYSNEQIEMLPVEIIGKVVELRGKF